MSSDRQQGGGGGLSLQTLLISSAAAVIAATVVPLFWEQGTLFATAMTPIVVALVSEALKKPAERITAVTPRVARRSATGAAVRRFEPDAARTPRPERIGARGEGPERFESLPPPPRRSEDDPFGLRAAERPRRPRLRLAVLTGLLAFVVAAAVVTLSELTIFDGSVSGERGKTSLFGGQQRPAAEEPAEEATPTATPEATGTPPPEATPEGEATPTPAPTETPAPAEPVPPPAEPTPAG